MKIPPLRIVLSGGGIRGVSYVGVFLELEKQGFLKNIKDILGVSCGAMFGFAHILGYTPTEMYSLASCLDFSLLQNIDPDVALNYFTLYGVDDGSNLEKFLESLVKNKGFSKTVTFQELYEKVPVMFRCYAVELNSSCYIEFSQKETPDCEVLFALRASMCIPGYFTPLVQKNKMYVDGGVLNNYPIDLFSFEEQKTILGVRFTEFHKTKEERQIQSLEEFLYQVISCSYMIHKKKSAVYEIVIPCGDFPVWKFDASQEERHYLMDCGRKAVNDFFEMRTHTIPSRRYSVG